MISKKKLAIFINNLGHGGAQKIASIIAKDLNQHFEIYLVLLENRIVYDIPADIKIVVLNKKDIKGFVGLISNIPRYFFFCKKNKIDISLSLLTQPNYIASITKILGSKSKIVLSEHTYQSLWRAEEHFYAFSKKLIIQFLYNRVDRVITVSNKIRVDLMKNNKIKKEKIVTIFNPYPISHINALSKIEIDGVKRKSETFNFVTVGTLYHVKNQELLLRSFAKLNYSNIHLIIVGDGELKSQLIDLSKQLEIESKVSFIGFTDNPFKYIGASDVFVLSSNNEGLPNVIIEALACQCPVLSTDCISGPREILAPNTSINYQLKDSIEFAEFGVLVPIKNVDLMTEAMETLILNKNLLINYKEKALDRAMFFDAKKSMKNYIDNLYLK